MNGNLCGQAQDPGYPSPGTRTITLANVDNPQMLSVGILSRSTPFVAGPNTLLIFTGTALVDVGLNGDDNARSFDVILDLGVTFDNNPLTFFQSAPVAALASPVFNPSQAGAAITCAVNCTETDLDENLNLRVFFHCGLTGTSAGINRIAYQVNVLAFDNRFPPG